MKKLSLSLLSLMALASCQKAADPNVYYPKPYAVVDETYVHKYGFEVKPDEWESRGEHGQKITTLNNGVTVVQNFSFGELDGLSTYTYPYSSSIERVQKYDKGQLVSDETRYLGDTPKKRLEYLNGGLTRLTQWYESGSPQSVELLGQDKSGQDKLHKGDYFTVTHQLESQVVDGTGTRTNRDPFGQVLSKDTFENGQMIERVSFWANGTPKEMLPYKNGIVHGLRRTFYVGGEPDKVEAWADGKQSGITIVYQNGEKYAEVPYVNGLKSGLEKRYRDGRELFEEITWVDGYENGPSQTYKPAK
jgi:antitoxin component YwqK of YwqJK toxin-antitoxin module